MIVDAASPAKANMQWIKCYPLRAHYGGHYGDSAFNSDLVANIIIIQMVRLSKPSAMRCALVLNSFCFRIAFNAVIVYILQDKTAAEKHPWPH